MGLENGCTRATIYDYRFFNIRRFMVVIFKGPRGMFRDNVFANYITKAIYTMKRRGIT